MKFVFLVAGIVAAIVPNAMLAATDERFPQRPAEFLSDPANTLLRAAIDQDDAKLRALEKDALTSGGFNDAKQLTSYGIALLAMGRTEQAKVELANAALKTSDAQALQVIRFATFFALMRERAFAAASQILGKACSPDHESYRKICLHLAAQVSSFSGDQVQSLAAIRQLHHQYGVITFPADFISKEPQWDALRVANYVVAKDFDQQLWDINHQTWQKTLVRSNYINAYDVEDAKSFGDAWTRLEKLLEFEFDLGNYQSALDWLTEFDLKAQINGWQLPIERHGYAARAHYSLGKYEDAKADLKDAEIWIQKTFKTPTDQYLALLDFSRTFNVPGLEGLANPFLEEIWSVAFARKETNIDYKLVAFEIGLRLLENYTRIVNLEKFESLRQPLIPLANQLERVIPDKWPGKRFDSGWIELKTADAILQYDPKPERLAEKAAVLSRYLEVAKREIDLTRDDAITSARELKEKSNPSNQRVSTRTKIQQAASEFQQELIPVLGEIYLKLQQFDQAVPLLRSAYNLSMQESVCGRPTEQVAHSIELLKAAQLRGNKADIKTWTRETKACLLAWNGDSPQLAWMLVQDASEYSAKGNFYSAEYALARAIRIQQRLNRSRDRDLATYLHQYATLLHNEGDLALGLDLMRSSADIIVSEDRERWTAADQTIIEHQIAFYADLLNGAQKLPDRKRLFEDAFRLSQLWLNNDAGRAVEDLARRNQIADQKLAALIQQKDELYHQIELRDRQFAGFVGTTNAWDVLKQRQMISDRMRDIDRSIESVDLQLVNLKPNLVTRQPLSIHDVASLLRADETLFHFVFGETEVVRWTMIKSEIFVDHLHATSSEVSDLVKKIRCSVDPLAWSIDLSQQTGSCADRRLHTTSKFDVFDVPFDLKSAHELYVALFSDVDQRVTRSWTIIPSGILSSLSFAVLVVAPPTANGGELSALEDTNWLAVQNDLTVLPAVSSIRSLRRGITQASRPYIGFGNPVLLGQVDTSDFNSCEILKTNSCQRILPIVASLGARAQATLASFPPIPQTTCELCAVADYLHLGDSERSRSILLGPLMTRASVKKLGTPSADGRSELQNYQIVHFATHGVMAGQLSQTSQPGLLMSVPKGGAAELVDVVLTAGDIAELKLDAEWVLLSACNTAASNERGGEAFSGLARAFLYAGAKSVLVSHWSVSTNAAVKISTLALRALTANERLTRAQALRTAIQDIIREGRNETARGTISAKLHPSFWGPFALIGATQ